MPTGLSVITPPQGEPIARDGPGGMKEWLRVDFPDNDGTIDALTTAARQVVEGLFDCALLTQTLMMTTDRFPRYSSSSVWQYNSDAIWQQRLPVTQLSGQWYPDRAAIRVPRAPLQSVVSIYYTDGNGVVQLLDPSVYNVDNTTRPARIAPAYGQIWPIVRQQMASCQMTYTCGYGGPADVPQTILTAIKLLVSDWYYERERPGEMSPGVRNLLWSEWDGEYK